MTVRGPPVSKQNQVAGDAERHRFLGAAVRPFFVAFLGGASLPASLLIQRTPWAPSFAARRKIEEKGVPRRRKLHILRFAFRGKSSVIPLLLLSPPNPLRWALAGAPFCTVSTDSIVPPVLRRIRWH